MFTGTLLNKKYCSKFVLTSKTEIRTYFMKSLSSFGWVRKIYVYTYKMHISIQYKHKVINMYKKCKHTGQTFFFK